MSAQQGNPQMSSQSGSKEDQQNQRQLQRRSVSDLPSLWTEPFDAFMNPFSLMRKVQEEVNRVFAQSGLAGSSGAGEQLSSTSWTPALEIISKEGELEISAELPGLTQDDIKVEIDNDVLVIRGERKMEHESTEGGVRRSERRYGQFYRAVALPEGSSPEDARAQFENGLLRITIPMPQAKSNAREIPIQATGAKSTQAQPEKGTTKGDKAA